MTEGQLREAYLKERPSADFHDRVMETCRRAKKHRTMMLRRTVSAAACFALVLVLSVYGFSPVPTLSSGENAVSELGTAAVLTELPGAVGLQSRQLQEYAIAPAAETGDTPLAALTLDRSARVEVSAGELLRSEDTGELTALGRSARIGAGELFYWQTDGAESAELTARSGLRTLKVQLLLQDGEVRLVKQS